MGEKLKKKLKSALALFVLGVIFIIVSIVKGGHAAFMSIGCTYVVLSVMNYFKLKKIYSDEDRAKAYEIGQREERMIFIADKSRSLTFAIILIAEFIGGVIFLFLGKEGTSTALFILVVLQMIIYYGCHYYFSKKY